MPNWGYSHNSLLQHFSPTPAVFFETTGEQPVFYPAGGPFYPTAFANMNGLSGNLNLEYRTVPLGPRVDRVDTQATRLLVGAEGTATGWDFNTALLYSQTRESDTFVSGWVAQDALLPALATGLINPFGPSGSEGDALLASTQTAEKCTSCRRLHDFCRR